MHGCQGERERQCKSVVRYFIIELLYPALLSFHSSPTSVFLKYSVRSVYSACSWISDIMASSSSSSHIPDPCFVCFSEYIADLQLPLSLELLLTRRYFFLHHQLSVSFRFLCSLYFIFPASPSLQLCLQFLNT